ncbi:MAG: hypothetical protein LBH65_02725, partial [Desulfovibrio sp.]|nr:hypothetical protein [Desulfovibrio sp.]
GEIVYSVTYGVLPSGWRVTPQHPEASTAVVVFGCSFAFGEGLEDEQSFPWQLAERLGPGYQVFNFGFPGYGAHHMLSWIESGILDDIAARYSKVHVFYSTIRGHELRGLGYSQWDPYGPWYGFDKGRIVRKGVFADDISPLRPATDALFGKSLLYRKFLKTKLIPHFLRFKHHAAIIKEADRQSRRIAGAPLTAVLWPRVLFAEAIREEGVDILDLSPLFPDWENGPDKYRLHPSDGHPNALAASIVAKALADYVRSNP